MKPYPFFSLLYVGLVCLTATFMTSCNREQACECVPTRPDFTTKVFVNLNGETLQAEAGVFKGIQDGFQRETADIYSEQLLQYVNKFCSSQGILFENQLFSIALYCDSLVTQMQTISAKNVKGISIYDVSGRKIMHHLYVRDGIGKFHEVENVRIRVPGITSNHLHYYLQQYVFENPQNKSWISIDGDLSKEIYNNSKKYLTPFRLERRSGAKEQVHDKDECNSYDNCRHNPPGIYMPCIKLTTGRYVCSATIPCSGSEIYTALQNANRLERSFVNLDLMYRFRDEFLYQYNKGEDYIDYYYLLSSEYQGNISFALAIQTALVLRNFNGTLDILIDPENHLSEVPFTENVTNSLLSLLDAYSNITESADGQQALANIRADVLTFRGKTVEEILEELQ